jgi:hypothetical protein
MKFQLPLQPQLSCGHDLNIRFRLPDGSLVSLKEWAEHKYTHEEIKTLSDQIAEAIRKQLTNYP